MKRFQECNIIEKIWACRWYITAPFLYLRYKTSSQKIIDINHRSTYPSGKLIWKITISEIQIKMN